jgi:hypothetical protein
MARRRTARKKRRSSPRATSLISMLELYALTNIMSQGLTGYSPWAFLTGETDIGGKA